MTSQLNAGRRVRLLRPIDCLETVLASVPRKEALLQQQVWTDYVVQMVQRKGNECLYPLEQTRPWLTWLAQQMRVHQQTIFYAEYLDPGWLTSNHQRIVTWLTIRVPAFVLGILVHLLVFIFVVGVPNLVSLYQIGLFGGFVGGWLSRNTGTRIAKVGSPPSAAKWECMISCILLGILMAASLGFFLGQGYSLGDWIRDGSILGLGSGLSAWVFLVFLFRLPRQQASVSSTSPSLRWRVSAWFNTIAPPSIWQAALMLGTGIVVSSVLIGGLSGVLNNQMSEGLSGGLQIIMVSNELGERLSGGLSFGLRGGLIEGLSRILTVVLAYVILDTSLGTLRFMEGIYWTWQSLRRPEHLRISVIITSVICLLYGLDYGLSLGLGFDLSYGLSIGLSYWLLLGLYQGMKQEHIEDQDRHQFNQGIYSSLYNGALVSLVSASIITSIAVLSHLLSIELMNGLSLGLTDALGDETPNVLSAVGILEISGLLLIWSMSGGLTILRHYVIRWLLARSHRFPWRAQAFLDDATARILLQRVGGGYRFMHRLLLDYFADLETASPSAISPTGSPMQQTPP